VKAKIGQPAVRRRGGGDPLVRILTLVGNRHRGQAIVVRSFGRILHFDLKAIVAPPHLPLAETEEFDRRFGDRRARHRVGHIVQ
jgi:hypothetical protein